jgi:hypothetical protein
LARDSLSAGRRRHSACAEKNRRCEANATGITSRSLAITTRGWRTATGPIAGHRLALSAMAVHVAGALSHQARMLGEKVMSETLLWWCRGPDHE